MMLGLWRAHLENSMAVCVKPFCALILQEATLLERRAKKVIPEEPLQEHAHACSYDSLPGAVSPGNVAGCLVRSITSFGHQDESLFAQKYVLGQEL